MDQALSQLLPINRIGQDGFNWWVGQVELTSSDEENNNGGYRFKVRIVGEHPQSKELLDTSDLPWCNVIMPVNVPFMPGNIGGATPQLDIGCWVVGFYLDPERQKPLIMGSIGQTPGATTIVNNRRPDDLPFTTSIPTGNVSKFREGVNPAKDGTPAKENKIGITSQTTTTGTTTINPFVSPQFGVDQTGLSISGTLKTDGTNRSTGGLTDGSTTKDGKERVPIPPAKKAENAAKEENWCQTIAQKCEDPDLQTEMTTILGEMLAEIQNNGGQFGDYLVNKYTGGLYSGTEVARKYVNKSLAVIQHFIAKIKGFITTKLENAVKDLINALLYPSETGNVLTPVTEFFNKLLKDLGCQMADLGDRLATWLTNVLMDLVTQIYQAAICQIDTLVNGIISQINSLLEEVLSSVLGPLQEILGSIAEPLNIIGGTLNYVMQLLGISCSGPDQTCSQYKQICTDGNKKKSSKDKDFLDGLISDIDNLFPATGTDYTAYTCDDAYEGSSLEFTTVGFTGGVPAPAGSGPSGVISKPKIIYTIDDITVEEGSNAIFTITRSGFVDVASSVEYKVLEDQGTAEAGTDYYTTSADILGFSPGEISKTISIKTFIDNDKEKDETFFVAIKLNSPDKDSGISTQFLKSIGQCIITEKDKTKKTPYTPKTINPYKAIESIFPAQTTPTTPYQNTGDPTQNKSLTTPFYSVSPDKTSVKEGEFITFLITTTNVENGTIAYYSINGVSQNDIIGGKLSGQFTVNSNKAKVVVGIEEDNTPEDYETLTFTINGTGATSSVLIVPDNNKKGSGSSLEDFDFAVDEGPNTTYTPFVYPTVDPEKIITDENGGIISIPIENPGDRFVEPPTVFIGGNGIGATAIALLDNSGYVTELRVTSPGYNYKINLSTDNELRCIIDSFTLIRPGIQYETTPEMYVNGELGIAESIINDDGFVIGARLLDRTKTYTNIPDVLIVGGGGYGAKLLPSLVCLDNDTLERVGSTKIGTGRYVDCP